MGVQMVVCFVGAEKVSVLVRVEWSGSGWCDMVRDVWGCG